MTVKKRIARIDEAHLERDHDHGIFTVWLGLDYGNGEHQGAGMRALDRWDAEASRRVGTAYGMEFILRLLDACGVSAWDALVGRTVFVHASFTEVYGIEPLPTEPGTTFMFDDLQYDGKE